MKENVIDVLAYLFDNYIDPDTDNVPEQMDKQGLELMLEKVGFDSGEINKALIWLENITVVPEAFYKKSNTRDRAVRIYSAPEMQRLDTTCRGYLLFLEQAGLLDDVTREVVLERVMALDVESIDLADLKQIILLVMFYQPGQEAAYAWVEDLVFDDLVAAIH